MMYASFRLCFSLWHLRTASEALKLLASQSLNASDFASKGISGCLCKVAAQLASGTEEILEEEVSSPNASDNETERMVGVVQPPRRTLGDYGQATNGENANLGFQPANPVTFDIKNTVLNALKENQFSGAESECPNIHLSHFYEACGYTDPPGVSESNKRLRLFKLSLTGRTKDWINTLPSNTITTWDELELKFHERYFPIHKFLERRNDITNFEQGDSESFYNAWERFKLCMKKCPKHGLDNHAQMQNFTQRLRPQTRMLLDASAGGSLKNKDESKARELVKAMAQNEYRVQNDRGAKKKGSEEAMYLSNFKKSNRNNNPYLNTYNPDWRDHPNFGWGGNQNQSQQQPSSQNSQQRQQSQLEDALAQFIKVTQGNFEEVKISQNQLKVNQEQMKANQDMANKNHEASIKSLETQISQLSRQFSTTQSKGVEENEDQKEKDNSVHAKLPYPRKKKVNEEDPQQFKKFMKMLHNLQMNIPFVETLEQMPVYAKFMKELLTKKQKPLDDDTVNMTEECSAIIQKKLPQKKKDLGSFTIPCSIGNLHVRGALCDLGACINLMPLSMMKRIPGAVAKPTKMQLYLADRSITYPYGILQNVLVRCAEFVFPTDFVILDMEEDSEVSLLLGRPFLATGRTLIYVEKGELMIQLDDEQVCFQLFEATKFGGQIPECFKVDALEELVNDMQEEEWDHEIELFLQHLGDDCEETETLNLEGTLIVKELKKDDDALVWGSDDTISAFCWPKTNKEEEVNSGIEAYKSFVPPLEGLKSLLNRGETNLKYPP
ncbi:hypothetical protein TSUD_393640 [Trifolium subterraneum]|uniref:Retrotransposon gag domain-containing protein n=1 Tax=Trifolium subterraneum TaxID=3900 RepID=A0A2Z6MNW5_TRISU|nr:hypothetical protein TSUD_393640 [Trifolium subterraneum]